MSVCCAKAGSTAGEAAELATLATGEAKRSLGLAPPCKSYKDLLPLIDIEKRTMEALEACFDKDALRKAQDLCRHHRGAVSELLQLTKAAAKDL